MFVIFLIKEEIFIYEILFYVCLLSKSSWKDIHTQFINNNQSIVIQFKFGNRMFFDTRYVIY